MEAFHWALATCMEAFSEGTWYFAFALDSLWWDFLDEELRVPIRSVCDLFFIFSLLLPLLSSRFAVSCNLFFLFSQTWFSMLFFLFESFFESIFFILTLTILFLLVFISNLVSILLIVICFVLNPFLLFFF